MDPETIRTYDARAGDYAREWEDDQPPPDDLRAVVERYFGNGPTVDVGCGSGRDTAWLASAGYDVLGVDASAGLLAEARRRHPGVRFAEDALPGLESLPGGTFANVLCETVIMHLAAPAIPGAVRRLAGLLAPGGALYLSWRVTEGADLRDGAGRLYASFGPQIVRDALSGADLELDEQRVSASSGKVVHRILARRTA